jgi:hypothetical protein
MSQQQSNVDQSKWNDLSGVESSTRAGVVSDQERSQYLPLTEETSFKHSNAGQPWSQSSNQTPMLDPHLDRKSDRGYQSQDPLTSFTESSVPASQYITPLLDPHLKSDRGYQSRDPLTSITESTVPGFQYGTRSNVTTTETPLYQHEVNPVQSGSTVPAWSFNSGPESSSDFSQTQYQQSQSQPQSQSIVDKGMQVAQQGMQKLGLGTGSTSSSQGPSIVDKGAAMVQQGVQKLSNMTSSSSSQHERPLLQRTDDREITMDQGPVQKLQQSLQTTSSSDQSQVSPLEKLLNTFNLMDSLETGMSSAGESVIPSMKQSLVQYEETIRSLVTIMEGSEQGQRIIRHLTELVNIIQDYLAEFAPPTDSHEAQQWLHKLNLRLKRINVEPTDNMTEVLALFGLNEAMDRMETTPGLPILLSRLGRVMNVLGRNKLTEYQTKTILKDTADLATSMTTPAATVLDESHRAISKIQDQGGIAESLRQFAAQPSDPDSIQGFVDTIKEWTLTTITTVLPTVKIPQYEGETPSIKYKVGKIDLSNVNITKDMVNVSVDHETGQIFAKVAGVDVNVFDLPWRVKHKKLKITSSGLADATTKDATWSMGLGLNYNTQVPDIPAIVITSPPCLKIGKFDVTVKHSKLSPLANMFMGLFKRSIKNTIENRVEEELERSMIQGLDNLNIAIQKTAPRLKRLVELGRLLIFKGQETQKHIHEREKSIEHDEFENYQPDESEEYEPEDAWDRDFSIYQHREQAQPLLEQPFVQRSGPTVVHTYNLPSTIDVPRAEPLQSSWDTSSVGTQSSASSFIRDLHVDRSRPDWDSSYSAEKHVAPSQSYFPASASIVQQDRDLFGQSSNLGLGQSRDQGIMGHQPDRTSAGAGHPDYFGQSGSVNPTLGSSLSGGVSRMVGGNPSDSIEPSSRQSFGLYSDNFNPSLLAQEQDALHVKADITKHNTGQVDYDIHAERKPESRIQGEGDHGLRQHAYRMQGQGGNDRA